MEKAKKHLLSIMIIGITSQIYLMLFTNGFAVSAGIITFFIIYYFYRDLNAIVTGIFSGIFVCLLRVLVSVVYGGNFLQGFISHFPEIFFYIVIGLSVSFFMKIGFFNNLNKVFFPALITDILANGTEMYIRNKIGLIILDYNIVKTLILVAFSRAFIVWIILNALKYYRIILLNKENAEKFINFMLDGKISNEATTANEYINTNKAAKKYMSKKYLNNKAVFIPDSELKRAERFRDVGNATKTYDLIWSEFKQK